MSVRSDASAATSYQPSPCATFPKYEWSSTNETNQMFTPYVSCMMAASVCMSAMISGFECEEPLAKKRHGSTMPEEARALLLAVYGDGWPSVRMTMALYATGS